MPGVDGGVLFAEDREPGVEATVVFAHLAFGMGIDLTRKLHKQTTFSRRILGSLVDTHTHAQGHCH